MNKKILFFCFILFQFNSYAQNLSQSFPAGSGSEFEIKFKQDNTKTNLSIYIAATRTDSVFVEFFIETKDLIPLLLWQQFEIGITTQGSEIRSGYIQGSEFNNPEIIPKNLIKEESGIPLTDFLFKNDKNQNANFLGDEIVEVAAGSTKAKHFQITKNKQILDYWISDEAKPLGLVMLTSKNPEIKEQNYSIQLLNIIENKKAKILPEKAIPLTEKGKSILLKKEKIK